MTTNHAQREEAHLTGELPEGWVTSTLGQVCEINPPKPNRGTVSNDLPVTFVPMPAVDAESGAIASPSVRPFAEVAKGFTSFRDGDVILAKITPCMENGKAAIAKELTNGLGFGSTEFHVLRPTEGVLAEYVYYYIRQESFRQAAAMEMTGSVGQKRVPATFVERVEISVPPLPEQKQIVEAIERLTARVNAARARLAVVPAILKRFRQAVLAAACSGRLTEEWRESNGDATDSIGLTQQAEVARSSVGRVPCVKGVPQGLDAPPGWTCIFFGNILTLLTSGSRGWAEFYSTSGPLFVRSQDINTDQLVLDDAARVTPPANSADRARTRVQQHDVLLTITGANVTKCALVNVELSEAYVSQHVALCRPALPAIGPFLHLWLTSRQHGRGVLLDVAYGAGKPGLNLENIKEVPLALPPLKEQAEIVRRVESLMKLADAIENRVAAAQTQADKLTQSILSRAFRGELIATPDTSSTITARAVVWRFEDFAAIQAEIVRRFPSDPTLGRKKLFKLSYLAASQVGARTEAPLRQDAAGPYDGKLQAAAEQYAAERKWFLSNTTRNSTDAHYRKGVEAAAASTMAKQLLNTKAAEFEQLMTLAKGWDSNAAELHATVHAAWNALVIENVEVTPDAIASRFFAWSDEKAKRFSKWQVESARQMLVKLGLTPTGKGPLVEGTGQTSLFGNQT